MLESFVVAVLIHALIQVTGASSPEALSVRGPAADKPPRTWVFFTDKALHDPATRDAALRQRAAELSPLTLQRRAHRRTDAALLDERDIAPPAAYIDAISATGARVRHISRWLNAVS